MNTSTEQARAALAGLHVLIARPAAQACSLATSIRQYGGIPVLVPALEIVGLPVSMALRRALARCVHSDAVIFVSRNAVTHAAEIAPLINCLPAVIFALGTGTAAALRERGVSRVLTPDTNHHSESLLALPELSHVCGKRLSIVRGRGGREILRDELVARGAIVDYVEVYRRRQPADCGDKLRQALAAGLDAVVVNSGETLENLLTCLAVEERDALLTLPLFAPSDRVAQLAKMHGFTQAYTSRSPDAHSTTANLIKYLATQKIGKSA